MKDEEFDGNIIQFLNDRNKKLELLSNVANNMLHCIVMSQDISALKKARSSGKIVPWQEQALAQIELFLKLYKELNP